MKFEVTESFKTQQSKGEVYEMLIEKFQAISEFVTKNPPEAETDAINSLIISDISCSFGSINKTDTTRINLTIKNNCLLCTAITDYRPSGWFWLFFTIGILFWFVGMIIPIGFYMHYKNYVRKEIQNVLHNIKTSVTSDSATTPSTTENNTGPHSVSEISKSLSSLKDLLDKGAITQQEFLEMKKEILKQNSITVKKSAG